MDFTKLKTQIEEATKQAFIEIAEQCKLEEIYAFALYSDEGAMTICPSTNTLEHLEENKDDEDFLYYKFEPAEWKYEMQGASKLFDDISKQCEKEVLEITNDKTFKQFQKQLYETCIEVLDKLKSEGFFKKVAKKDIFLIFTVLDYGFSKKELKRIVNQLNNNKYDTEYLEWVKSCY